MTTQVIDLEYQLEVIPSRILADAPRDPASDLRSIRLEPWTANTRSGSLLVILLETVDGTEQRLDGWAFDHRRSDVGLTEPAGDRTDRQGHRKTNDLAVSKTANPRDGSPSTGLLVSGKSKRAVNARVAGEPIQSVPSVVRFDFGERARLSDPERGTSSVAACGNCSV